MHKINKLTAILKAYRERYGLTQEVVERLAKLKKGLYSRIESEQQSPRTAEIEAISNVYGLEGYQMSNPKYRMPSIKKLPNETQKAILEIKKKKTQTRTNQNKIDLGKEIDILINTGKLDKPITAKKLFDFLPEPVKTAIKNDATKITDILTRSPKNKVIQKVSKPKGETAAGNWYQKIEEEMGDN